MSQKVLSHQVNAVNIKVDCSSKLTELVTLLFSSLKSIT